MLATIVKADSSQLPACGSLPEDRDVRCKRDDDKGAQDAEGCLNNLFLNANVGCEFGTKARHNSKHCQTTVDCLWCRPIESLDLCR